MKEDQEESVENDSRCKSLWSAGMSMTTQFIALVVCHSTASGITASDCNAIGSIIACLIARVMIFADCIAPVHYFSRLSLPEESVMLAMRSSFLIADPSTSSSTVLTLTSDLDVVTKVTGLAVNLDAVVEVLLESGGVKDTVVGGAREVNEELVRGLALLGSLGGLGNSHFG